MPAPRFAGDVTYRQAPPTAGQADNVTGDLVIVSKAELAADKLLLTSYTIVPDENRAGTRLTGAAEVTLGAEPKFNAVISGGTMALPPRDATAEAEDTPYELVRLLTELPLPPVPGMAGTIGVDIAELDIRAVSLRNVRLDATTDAEDLDDQGRSRRCCRATRGSLTGRSPTRRGRRSRERCRWRPAGSRRSRRCGASRGRRIRWSTCPPRSAPTSRSTRGT